MIIAWQTINAVRRPSSSRLHARVPRDDARHHDQGPPARPATQRPRRLLRQPGARAPRHARRPAQGPHRHHQLPRLQAAREARTLQGRTRPPARPRPVDRHPGNRRPDAPARHAGAHGHAQHPRDQRRGAPLLPREARRGDEEGDLKGDDRKEAEKNREAARLWINGLDAVQRKLGLQRVVDLSATPFFLRGSGYAEGTLFPWTMSDFSLMDAIECGIVKLPRVPVADNIPGADVPIFRNLWENIRPKMPKKGRGKGGPLDPLKLPMQLETALQVLYGHYDETAQLWEGENVRVPPCFIVVCNNTATSKLVYDYISGFERTNDAGLTTVENGRLARFRNFEDGQRLPLPRTLLIDSEQLESGDALDPNFRRMASRRDRALPPRARPAAAASSTAPRASPTRSLLREVMNTVGKPGQLGSGRPLRRLRLHAHRGLGRQHRHPRARRARLRDATALRAGDRPIPAPPVLRPQRGEPLQRRVRRRAGHPLRLRRQARGLQAAAPARGGASRGRQPRTRSPGDPLPPRRGLPGGAAGGTARRQVHRRTPHSPSPRTSSGPPSRATRASSARASTSPSSTPANCGSRPCSSTSPSG